MGPGFLLIAELRPERRPAGDSLRSLTAGSVPTMDDLEFAIAHRFDGLHALPIEP
jgi:hypothetical protein